MRGQELLEKIKSIKSWKSGDRRAPHKPLLVLFALGRLQSGVKQIEYAANQDSLKSLLEEFGPPNNPRPYYPFTRLANDGIWEIQADEELDLRKDYSNKRLRELHSIGHFTEEVSTLFQESPALVNEVVGYLLDNNFPQTLHRSILDAVGLELGTGVQSFRKPRDPNFRKKVLEAYERSCAVCGYQIRRDDQIVGLEAAHVKWHSAGGPDTEQNGVAMCILHHELFDRGLFTIEENLMVKVSRRANGNHAFNDWLLKFHNEPIRKPQSKNFYPEPEFVNWQVREVFKGSFRD